MFPRVSEFFGFPAAFAILITGWVAKHILLGYTCLVSNQDDREDSGEQSVMVARVQQGNDTRQNREIQIKRTSRRESDFPAHSSTGRERMTTNTYRYALTGHAIPITESFHRTIQVSFEIFLAGELSDSKSDSTWLRKNTYEM